MPRLAAVSLALLVLAPASLARARLGHLDASGITGLSIAREDLELRCTPEGEREITCAITVRWELVNDGDGARSPELGLSWEGDPTAVEVRVAEAVLATEMPTHRRVRLLVPAHSRVVLEMRATQRMGAYTGTGTDIPILDPHDALAVRHPLLATRWEIVRRGFGWLRPSAVHFESVGPTTVRIARPGDWVAEVHAERAPSASTDGTTWVFTYTPIEAERAVPRPLGIELARGVHTEILRNGGPFIAIGGTFHFGGARGEHTGFRGRLGYELGLGEWVLASIAADTDFEHQVTLTPLVEVASYSLLIGPSFSAGIGLPIEVTNGGRAGMRLETSATFYSVAFVSSFDYWPNDGTWQVHLLGRIGI